VAKYKTSFTPELLKKRQSQGCGQGYGENYKPWLTVRDVPSRGLSSRILGWKTNRIHHFLAKEESSYFYILDWSIIVIDIREQYPLLPQSSTLEIAYRLGIKPPTDPKTQLPIVMTTDFLIDVVIDGKIQKRARTIKLSNDLSNRTLEKLQIERIFWEERGVDWGIVTELDINQQLSDNVKWLHNAKDIGSIPAITEEILVEIVYMLKCMSFQNYRSLAEIGSALDKSFNLPTGAGLRSIRHLIANRRWIVDMNQPLKERNGISFSIGFPNDSDLS
jgi:hypothetical protein